MAAKAQKPKYDSIEDFLKNIKPWEYDFKYQYENFDADRYWNLDEDDGKPLVRLLKYKKELKNGDDFIKGNAFDCDGTGEIEDYVCKLTRKIYRTLWGWQDEYCPPKITKRTKKTIIKRYACAGFDPLLYLGPDTMNSFFTAFEHYLKIALHRNMDQAALYAEMVVGGRDIPFAEERIEKLWISYAERHHSIGNFVLVPEGFNTERNKRFRDFWDLSLQYLKQQVSENVWLNESRVFERYINYFFLWDYVACNEKKSEYYVKSLLLNEFRNSNEYNSAYMVSDRGMPTDRETPIFLENAMWAIRRRGIFMTAMLQLQNDNKQVYEQIRNKVFLSDNCYCDYSQVIDMIIDDLSKASDKAKEWLEKESEFAEAIRKHDEKNDLPHRRQDVKN